MRVFKSCIFTFLLVVCSQLFAQGDLLITPTRIVFEGNKQKEEINLYNSGNETCTYVITFVQKKMMEDGSFVSLENSDSIPTFANPYLRLFPRRVTLGPKESQVVVLQYKKRPDMIDGEYRSHLYFRADTQTIIPGNSTLEDSNSLSVQIKPIYGLTIPVIIRNGEVGVKSSISDIKIVTGENSNKLIKFTLNRIGNISLYGDIKIKFVPEKGNIIDVATVNGIGVYTSIDRRFITIPLEVNKSNLLKGRYIILYSSNGLEKQKEIITEGSIEGTW